MLCLLILLATLFHRCRPADLYVPVVFHIVHLGEHPPGTLTNVPDAQVHSQLAVLNAAFDALDVRFNCFQCIDRVNATRWTAIGEFTRDFYERTVMPETMWSPDDYLNVYVGPLDTAGSVAFAQFPHGTALRGVPAAGNATFDAVFVKYTHFGSKSGTDDSFYLPSACYAGGASLVHEVGHALGLRHIFGDDDGTCSGDDYCDDTPLQAGPSRALDCAPTASCGSSDLRDNFMDTGCDYCLSSFTPCQHRRMRAALLSGERRRSLLTSLALADSPTPAAATVRPHRGTLDMRLHLCAEDGRVRLRAEAVVSLAAAAGRPRAGERLVLRTAVAAANAPDLVTTFAYNWTIPPAEAAAALERHVVALPAVSLPADSYTVRVAIDGVDTPPLWSTGQLYTTAYRPLPLPYVSAAGVAALQRAVPTRTSRWHPCDDDLPPPRTGHCNVWRAAPETTAYDDTLLTPVLVLDGDATVALDLYVEQLDTALAIDVWLSEPLSDCSFDLSATATPACTLSVALRASHTWTPIFVRFAGCGATFAAVATERTSMRVSVRPSLLIGDSSDVDERVMAVANLRARILPEATTTVATTTASTTQATASTSTRSATTTVASATTSSTMTAMSADIATAAVAAFDDDDDAAAVSGETVAVIVLAVALLLGVALAAVLFRKYRRAASAAAVAAADVAPDAIELSKAQPSVEPPSTHHRRKRRRRPRQAKIEDEDDD